MVKFDDGLYDEAEKLVQRFATPSGTGSTQGTTAGMFLELGHCLYAWIHPPVQETVHGPGFL